MKRSTQAFSRAQQVDDELVLNDAVQRAMDEATEKAKSQDAMETAIKEKGDLDAKSVLLCNVCNNKVEVHPNQRLWQCNCVPADLDEPAIACATCYSVHCFKCVPTELRPLLYEAKLAHLRHESQRVDDEIQRRKIENG